jgi:hypothetical protein
MGEIPMVQEPVPDIPGRYKTFPSGREDLLVPCKILKTFVLPNGRSDLDKTCQT